VGLPRNSITSWRDLIKSIEAGYQQILAFTEDSEEWLWQRLMRLLELHQKWPILHISGAEGRALVMMI
jgi:hypothetical protein